jgi:hypothetical protein
MLISDSEFSCKLYIDLKASFGAGVACLQCNEFRLLDSVFNGNQAEGEGGGVVIEGYDIANANITVDNSSFIGNSASGDGGSLFVKDVGFNMTDSTFRDNRGNSGGAIRLVCSTSSCQTSITNSSFFDNTAVMNGGGFFWLSKPPLLTNLTFANNSALYGSKLASYSVVIELLKPTSRLMEEEGPLLVSGQIINENYQAALIDHYGNVVTSDNSTKAALTASDAVNTSITGDTVTTAVNGVFTFTNFKVTTDPGVVLLLVKVGLIDSYIAVPFEIHVRECIIGESLIGKDCIVCAPGSYNLSPGKACEDCPTGAVCYGNYTMVPEKGYWRSSNTTNVFFACPYSEACIGGKDPYSPTGLCKPGYKSNKCNGCESGYSRFGQDQCLACPDPISNAVILSLLAIGTAAFAGVLIKSSIKSAYAPKSLFSVYLKIFMNYTQIIVLTTTFNLNWPSLVIQMFAVQQTAGGVSDQVFSVDCEVSEDSYFTQIKLLTFLPLIIGALVLVVWIGLNLRQTVKDFRAKLMMSWIVLLFLIHPTIVKKVFGIFNCTEVETGEFWLSSDLSVRCWDAKHIQVVVCFAVSTIIVWCVSVPSLCLIQLIRVRKHLDEAQPKLMFGFLIHGYSPQHFYWEFVILYRKIIIIGCSVFLSQNIPVQALTVMLLLLVSLHMQNSSVPFINSELNGMELRSILVAAVTIYCGLYYLTDNVGETVKLVLFVAMLASNFYFLFYSLRVAFEALLLKLYRKFGHFRRLMAFINVDAWFERSIELARPYNDRIFDFEDPVVPLEVDPSCSMQDDEVILPSDRASSGVVSDIRSDDLYSQSDKSIPTCRVYNFGSEADLTR